MDMGQPIRTALSNTMAKVLLTDSDASFLTRARESLEHRNHKVVTARTLATALDRLKRHRPDIVILDPFLSDSEGYEACRHIRMETAVPMLVVTDNDEEVDKVVAFELGADDYMTKPVSMRELQARVAARLRLMGKKASEEEPGPGERVFNVGGLRVDLIRREVSKSGRRIDLRHKEFELLLLLIRNRARTLSRADLLRQVWGYQSLGSRTVDVHIDRLRKKIEDDPAVPRHILTERGVGYRFEA